MITEPAQTDLMEIDDYISLELKAPVAAKNLLLSIYEVIQKLSFSPQGYSKVRDDRLGAQGYRWIGVKNYVIFYIIDAKSKTVRVERILYGRRNWKHIL